MFDVVPELVAKIKALAGRQEATLFMTLFSAFAVLLYRLTAQKDILVGTPIAARRGAELEISLAFSSTPWCSGRAWNQKCLSFRCSQTSKG